MNLAAFLVLLNLFKIAISRYLPLLGDEAYYNLWSRYLALSYNDHPPMIAYIHWLINFLFGQHELAIRLGAITCLLISTLLIYLVGKEAFGKNVGIASAILFNLVPTYLSGGFFLTPEQPLLIFWLLSMFLALKLFKTQNKIFWYLLGISVGLGLLSKYPMIFFISGIFIFLLISKDNRHWFMKKEPYLALLIALLIFSPVIVWNIQQGFSSLSYHGSRLGSPKYLYNIAYYFLLQIVMFSPPIYIFAFKALLINFWKKIKYENNLFLLFPSISFPAFFVFLFISPFTLIGGHWTSTCYPGIILLICNKYSAEFFKAPFRKAGLIASVGIIIFINALFISYYAFLYPIPQGLKGKVFTINRELPKYIKEADVDYVYSNQMGVASLVAFYGKTDVYMPKGQWIQFDIWGRPELKKGDNILYFVYNNSELYKKLEYLFKKVEIDQQKRLFAKDSDILIKTQAIVCRNFKGGILP